MIDWPSTLPSLPLKDSWSFEPQDDRVFFETEVGPPITAPRGTALGGKASFAFVMTDAEVATFETFYATTLVSGTKAFRLTDPMTGSLAVWKFGKPAWSARYRSPGRKTISCTLIRLS